MIHTIINFHWNINFKFYFHLFILFFSTDGYSESEDEEDDVPGNILSGSVLSLASVTSVGEC